MKIDHQFYVRNMGRISVSQDYILMLHALYILNHGVRKYKSAFLLPQRHTQELIKEKKEIET